MTTKQDNLIILSRSSSNKIAIIHHDIEPAEIKFKDLFIEEGCSVDFLDIRNIKLKDFLKYDLVFNRVYSSVASRDYKILFKTLSLLKKLEKKGIKCVNSYSASLADYNKYELYKMLNENGVNTPPTLFFKSKKEMNSVIQKAIETFGFPLVIKRNCGGKSYEVTKVYTKKELLITLKQMFNLAKQQGYKAGFIIQKFIKSSRDHDVRVAIVEGKFLYSYSRSFISRNSEDKWMASTSGGSLEMPYDAMSEEIDIATRASKFIRASFSESDVIMTSEGPCIIEVNPTAGYFIDNFDDLDRMKLIVKTLINKDISLEVSSNQEQIIPLIPEVN